MVLEFRKLGLLSKTYIHVPRHTGYAVITYLKAVITPMSEGSDHTYE